MKEMLLIIKKELVRVFTDRRMLASLIFPGLLIFILYAIMGNVMKNVSSVDDDYSYQVYAIYEDCSQVYADDFYDYNSFGLGDDHSGLLFLVDMKNREIYISTTGKAMDMYNDIRIDKILDAIYTEFGSDKYFEGITKFMTIIENYDTMGLLLLLLL